MSGGRYKPVAGASPLDVIAEVEELLRRLLKGMATGELGGDLRVAADEILLSEGLSGIHFDSPGIGATAEWRLPEPRPDEALDLTAISDANLGEAEIEVRRTETRCRRPTRARGSRNCVGDERNRRFVRPQGRGRSAADDEDRRR